MPREWFLATLFKAIEQADETLGRVLVKTKFCQLAASDITELFAHGVLQKSLVGDRSTSYELPGPILDQVLAR